MSRSVGGGGDRFTPRVLEGRRPLPRQAVSLFFVFDRLAGGRSSSLTSSEPGGFTSPLRDDVHPSPPPKFPRRLSTGSLSATLQSATFILPLPFLPCSWGAWSFECHSLSPSLCFLPHPIDSSSSGLHRPDKPRNVIAMQQICFCFYFHSNWVLWVLSRFMSEYLLKFILILCIL